MKIGIIGCMGRMGQMLVKEVIGNPATTLSGAATQPGDQTLGKDVGVALGLDPAGILITDNIESVIKASDGVIDFTMPEVTLQVAKLCASYKKIHVSGTTGLSDDDKAALANYAKETPIVWASNMSVGVNLLFSLVEQVAGILDDSSDIEIVEMHHNKKVDAPSGTALTLGESAARGRKVALEKVACKARDGQIGARPKGEIGFATLRGGDVIGDHTVIFASQGERIELTHKASSRTIYASGAVRACLWAKGKKPRLYHMKDVLS
jgi:4-hydroxy-tetrahydrodipicolinate reductase